MVELQQVRDDSLGNTSGVIYAAAMGSTTGPVDFSTTYANGVSLTKQSTGYLYLKHSANAVAPNSLLKWYLRTTDGVTMDTTSISVPNRPTITSPSQYSSVSKSNGFSIGVNSSVNNGGGDAIAMIVYDPVRNKLFGGDTTVLTSGHSISTVRVICDDDGSLEIPSSAISKFAVNRIYLVHVFRWNYQTSIRSDSKKVGLVAAVSDAIPIKIVQ
jgi:hypothetical protein